MIDTRVMRKRTDMVGWILIIPTIISIILFIIYPLIFSTYISFTDWRKVGINISFIKFENYKWLFNFQNDSARLFWEGLILSVKFTFFSTLLQTFLGFILAYVLYSMGRLTQGVYKVIMYLPVILPMAVVTVMFKFFLEPQGLVNKILGLTSEGAINWLSSDQWTMFIVILINTWRFIGITIIIYFVSMNSVDKSIIESSTIDGAGKVDILTKILLPLTWSSSKINIILSIIGGLKSYDFFLVLTNGAGNTQVVGMYIYKTAFLYDAYCRAVTMSLILSFIIGIATFIVNKLAQKGEHENG